MFSLRSIFLTVLQLHLAQASKPQIGFELESFDMSLFNFRCSEDDYYSMKGHQVAGQRGNNWFLGVDDTPAKTWRLNPEYDIRCDLGDLESLKGITQEVKQSMRFLGYAKQVWVQNNQGKKDVCNPWKPRQLFSALSKSPDKAIWNLQATAPLMLEGIQDLLTTAVKKERNPLVGVSSRANLVYIQKSWIDSNQFLKEATGGSYWATQDMLGFLSVVSSTMRAATELSAPFYQPGRKFLYSLGPKGLIWIMPRHYWTSVFSLVRDKMPKDVKLWDILEHLACYRNTVDGQLQLDERFCDDTGDKRKPQPNGNLQKLAWSLKGGKDPLTVKEWIDSIQSTSTNGHDLPDALSEWDEKHFDGQIGGFSRLGKPFETALGSKRKIALWEFRGLGDITQSQISQHLEAIQVQVVKFHKRYSKSLPS
ncbi:uncharacterized protein LY79DRAFT_572082 [Colletotrichum navitas]|uniref:Uncharacterized protein n=1 Tax=Colletotrichum navitas TaxID=681940 RepID=A0AAD8UZ15_9PEZI|nr:uncharacterized protein LY79DRAFT_572082 [Colletotrichum navitas]KAK1566436.1 hypothetical protein LY79DRAFT_572082 [Colletotrichum navitas]